MRSKAAGGILACHASAPVLDRGLRGCGRLLRAPAEGAGEVDWGNVSHRLAVSVLGAAMALGACRPMGPTLIRSILDDPRTYDGRTVTIAGEVRDSTNLLLLKWYRVEDESGGIVVVASGAVPMRGANVRVSGTVRQAFVIGDQSLTVILEDAEGS